MNRNLKNVSIEDAVLRLSTVYNVSGLPMLRIDSAEFNRLVGDIHSSALATPLFVHHRLIALHLDDCTIIASKAMLKQVRSIDMAPFITSEVFEYRSRLNHEAIATALQKLDRGYLITSADVYAWADPSFLYGSATAVTSAVNDFMDPVTAQYHIKARLLFPALMYHLDLTDVRFVGTHDLSIRVTGQTTVASILVNPPPHYPPRRTHVPA